MELKIESEFFSEVELTQTGQKAMKYWYKIYWNTFYGFEYKKAA